MTSVNLTSADTPQDPGNASAVGNAILYRLAEELARLRALSADLEDTIATALEQSALGEASVQELQSLDLITQSLGDLSKLVQCLATEPDLDAVPHERRRAIGACMALADLSRRVFDGADTVPGQEAAHGTDVAWF